MSSKQLSSLIRKAPPATVRGDEPEEEEPASEPVRSTPTVVKKKPSEPEVPIQVKLPESIRKQLYHMSVEEGVSLRTLILRAIQGLGIEVPKDELNSRRRKLP
jgi:hypothetical protein